MNLHDVILELKNHKSISIHKSSLDIFRLLETNKDLFLGKIAAENLEHLLTSFENLSYANPKDYATTGYERDYKTQYDLLLFYLDKIV